MVNVRMIVPDDVAAGVAYISRKIGLNQGVIYLALLSLAMEGKTPDQVSDTIRGALDSRQGVTQIDVSSSTTLEDE
jgi:hypothetical protein